MLLGSTSALIAGAVAVSSSLWERFGRMRVFGQEDTSVGPPALLQGVDVSGFQVFADPTVLRAVDFAASAHAGQYRRTGEEYVTHVVETARILAGLLPLKSKRTVTAVVAALLHDVVDDTSTSLEDVARAFGGEVAKIVSGVTRLSQLNQLLRRHRRLEMVEGAWATATSGTVDGMPASDGATLRTLILSLVDDPRTLLIKLADRLHNMRTLYALAPDKARAVATETLGVWCSLAARLGVWSIKSELEDLCFAVLLPTTFLRLKLSLDEVWSGQGRAPTAALDEVALFERLDGLAVAQPGDEFLSPEQRRTRTLLACVLPFDLLTCACTHHACRLPRSDVPPSCFTARQSAAAGIGRAPASAAAALEALAACQRALRDELRLSAVTPGLDVTVQGRLKSLWSTHLKMQRKGCSAAEVYDARALRVVVEDTTSRDAGVETEACYSLLAAVHKLWRPVGGEMDDYIANPKASGYMSLHTAVRAPDGAPLEVQMRTRSMHEEAEYGAAAHWLYKDPQPQSTSKSKPPQQLLAAAAAVVEPLVRALATADGGPAARAAAQFAAALHPPAAKPAPAPPAPPPFAGATTRRVRVGAPLLRVAEGRLRDAVVVEAREGGNRMLVAIHLRERFGASQGRRATAADYGALAQLVATQGWHTAGQGDLRVVLEEFVLCSDGRYHKLDAYGRKLAACVELLDMPQCDAATEGQPGARRNETQSGDDALNEKTRLLRSLLTWEKDITTGEPSEDQAAPPRASQPSSSVVCIVWPQGATLRLDAGTTAGEVAARYRARAPRVNVNNALVPDSYVLCDGDIVLL